MYVFQELSNHFDINKGNIPRFASEHALPETTTRISKSLLEICWKALEKRVALVSSKINPSAWLNCKNNVGAVLRVQIEQNTSNIDLGLRLSDLKSALP